MYESNITLSVNLLSFLIKYKRIKNLNFFGLKTVGYFNILTIYRFRFFS